MTKAKQNLYGEFNSLALPLDRTAFAEAVQDWPPQKAGELRAIIRERFGDEEFTAPAVQHAASVLRTWPPDRFTMKALIGVGNTDPTAGESIAACLCTIRTYYWYLMAAYPDTDFHCFDTLSSCDGAALVEGIALAEEYGFSRYGGSVSLVCRAFHHFRRYGLHAWTALADRIIISTTNPYIPFNFRRTRAQWEACRTQFDTPERIWECVRCSEEAHRRAKEEKQKAEEQALAARRAARKQHRQARELSSQHNSAARRQILSELARLSPLERLERVIRDSCHPVTFYPDEYAVLDTESINTMSPMLHRATMERLADRRTGPWRRLYEELKNKA